MKVFVSYSFKDSELHIITLLIEQLRQKGFVVESSKKHGDVLRNNYGVTTSNFFIGIITNHSHSINSVLAEWRLASDNKIKSILVIEEGVSVENAQNLNYIRFDRRYPQRAIDSLLKKGLMPAANPKANNIEDIVAVGAIVVGIAALISILSGENK